MLLIELKKYPELLIENETVLDSPRHQQQFSYSFFLITTANKIVDVKIPLNGLLKEFNKVVPWMINE